MNVSMYLNNQSMRARTHPQKKKPIQQASLIHGYKTINPKQNSEPPTKLLQKKKTKLN